LKQRYDVVIVDSPPVLAVTDALTIAQCVDWTVMSVRWGATPRKIVKLALRRLASSGTKVAGATLAMVNSRRHAQYGYSDSMLYSKSFRDYQTAMTKKARRVAT
jgi:polysaccharide biosynthesis transport protein